MITDHLPAEARLPDLAGTLATADRRANAWKDDLATLPVCDLDRLHIAVNGRDRRILPAGVTCSTCRARVNLHQKLRDAQRDYGRARRALIEAGHEINARRVAP